MNPDGVFLSNGPGDPEPVFYAIENIRKLLGKKPIFGICLGHQLVGLALGGKTYDFAGTVKDGAIAGTLDGGALKAAVWSAAPARK